MSTTHWAIYLEFPPSNKRRKHLRNLTTLRVLPFACRVSLVIMIRPLMRELAPLYMALSSAASGGEGRMPSVYRGVKLMLFIS